MNEEIIIPMQTIVDYAEHILNLYAERTGNPFRLQKDFNHIDGTWQLGLVVPEGYYDWHPLASELYDVMSDVIREDMVFVGSFIYAAFNIPTDIDIDVYFDEDEELDPVNTCVISIPDLEEPFEDLIPWTVDPLPIIFTRFRNN